MDVRDKIILARSYNHMMKKINKKRKINNKQKQYKMSDFKWFLSIATLIIAIVIGLLFGIPKYNVWRSQIAIEKAENYGKAEMAQAEENRKIAIEEAKADLEVQKLKSESEIERAKGMAKAIEIENGKLTTKYIQYLWVRNIDKMDGDKIYIPTESNLPLLEARK